MICHSLLQRTQVGKGVCIAQKDPHFLKNYMKL
jgi:hypothetical protein